MYSCVRPWWPIWSLDVEAPTFSRQSAHKWRRSCQNYAPAAPLPPEDSWYSFVLEAESTPRTLVRLEGLSELRNRMTSSGIGPANFRLAAQSLNQLCYRVHNE
jgi:hypothetical protein